MGWFSVCRCDALQCIYIIHRQKSAFTIATVRIVFSIEEQIRAACCLLVLFVETTPHQFSTALGSLAPGTGGIYCGGSTIFINHEARRWRLRLTV